MLLYSFKWLGSKIWASLNCRTRTEEEELEKSTACAEGIRDIQVGKIIILNRSQAHFRNCGYGWVILLKFLF